MAQDDPMQELVGIHHALRGIRFAAWVGIFIYLWQSIDAAAPLPVRLFFVVILLGVLRLVWHAVDAFGGPLRKRL